MEEMRLQKFIANSGVCSRRKAEEYILAGKVKVNGKIVTELGTKVDSQKDEVIFNNKKIEQNNEYEYILLNKPVGYVTTVKDQFDRPIVLDLIKGNKTKVLPVGRLDMYTSGALILTNDGDFINKVTHPKNEIEKTYNADKMFYKNKIEHIRSIGFSLPKDVEYALSENYDRACFTKSQVKRDLSNISQSDKKFTLKEFMNYFNLTYKIIDDNLYFFDSEDTNIETHPPYDIDEIGIANLINDLNGYYEKYIFKDLSLKLAYTHHVDTSNMNYIQMYEYVKTHNLDYYMDIMPYLFGEKKLNIEELNDNTQFEEYIDVFEISKTNEELDVESDLKI